MPESVAVLLVALLPVTAVAALTLGWWLHDRLTKLVEAQPAPQSVREEYETLNIPRARRAFALEQARRWSALAKEDRERMGGQRAG